MTAGLDKGPQVSTFAAMSDKPIFYHKPGCPWCEDALEFFSSQGVELEIKDVLADMHQMRQLVALTGQSKCPSFRYHDFVVADFSVDEFKAKAARRPDVCKALGLKLN